MRWIVETDANGGTNVAFSNDLSIIIVYHSSQIVNHCHLGFVETCFMKNISLFDKKNQSRIYIIGIDDRTNNKITAADVLIRQSFAITVGPDNNICMK